MNETFKLFKAAIIDTRSQLQKFIDELNGQVNVLRTTVAHHLTSSVAQSQRRVENPIRSSSNLQRPFTQINRSLSQIKPDRTLTRHHSPTQNFVDESWVYRKSGSRSPGIVPETREVTSRYGRFQGVTPTSRNELIKENVSARMMESYPKTKKNTEVISEIIQLMDQQKQKQQLQVKHKQQILERQYHSHVTQTREDSDFDRSESDSPPQKIRKAMLSCQKKKAIRMKRNQTNGEARASKPPPSPYRKSINSVGETPSSGSPSSPLRRIT